jgi:hypothetical protein
MFLHSILTLSKHKTSSLYSILQTQKTIFKNVKRSHRGHHPLSSNHSHTSAHHHTHEWFDVSSKEGTRVTLLG